MLASWIPEAHRRVVSALHSPSRDPDPDGRAEEGLDPSNDGPGNGGPSKPDDGSAGRNVAQAPGADSEGDGTPERVSDKALMSRAGEGCRESFQKLLERYWPRLVAFSAEIVGGRDEANDVVQEAFIRVWVNRDQWSPIGTVRAYLYRIARNLSLNAVRDRRTRDQYSEQGGISLLGRHHAQGPEEHFRGRRVREEVEQAVNALPERRREVFILSRYHLLSHREIAETLDISPQTVANQMSAALAYLREELSHLSESG